MPTLLGPCSGKRCLCEALNMLKVKLPLRKTERSGYRFPAKRPDTPYYSYMYIHIEGVVRFVRPNTGVEVYRVPGVICPRS